MNKGFFFDRDGILNKLVQEGNNLRPPRNLQELDLNNELLETVRHLKDYYKLFVVSNQPDVSRGTLKLEDLKIINERINKMIGFEDIVLEVNDDPFKKKPSPFMINELVKKYQLDKSDSWIIGDRWVDIEAGYSAGINTILLEKEYSYFPTSSGMKHNNIEVNHRVRNFKEFASLVNENFLR